MSFIFIKGKQANLVILLKEHRKLRKLLIHRIWNLLDKRTSKQSPELWFDNYCRSNASAILVIVFAFRFAKMCKLYSKPRFKMINIYGHYSKAEIDYHKWGFIFHTNPTLHTCIRYVNLDAFVWKSIERRRFGPANAEKWMHHKDSRSFCWNLTFNDQQHIKW